MSRFFLIGLLFLAQQSVVYAQSKGEIFTIYLARHAEQQSGASDPANPPLTSCGELRAESLARILGEIKLEKIYSTSYQRTMSTALPTAEYHQLEVETYDPRKLGEFSSLLLDRKQSALVVGHSNTTGVLAGLLAGEEGEAFDEDIFDRLYQVVILAGQGHINILQQAFRCKP
jgi:broad specificity phosphatase PhoE